MKRFLLLTLAVILVIGLVISGCAAPAPAPKPSPAPVPSSAPALSPTSSPSAAQVPAPTAAPIPSTTAAAKQKTWKLKLGFEQPMTSSLQIYGHGVWASEVEKVTNGRVKVELYPNQTIAKGSVAWEATKSGVQDVAMLFTGYYPNVFDLLDSVTLPFIIPTTAEVGSRVAWALFQKFPEIQSQISDVKVLTVWTSEPYFLVTSKKQVKTIDDIKGMKIRTTGGPPTDMMKILGGSPMMIGMPDVYLNLQKGVVDGMLTPANAVVAFRIYEVVKYYTFVPTVCVSFMLIMNKDTWNEMPKDIQDAIMSVSGEAQAVRYSRDSFDRDYQNLATELKKVGYEMVTYTLPPDELARWTEIGGKPIWDAWVKKMVGKGYKSPPDILADTISLAKQYSSK